MKLTWFGGTTARIHIGGQMLVADAALAPKAIDPTELVSGADKTFLLHRIDPALPGADPRAWRPRKLSRLLDEPAERPSVDIFSLAAASVLVAAVGEPPLVLVAGAGVPFGRWADGAVAVLFGAGPDVARTGLALLDNARPLLLALAITDGAVDLAIDTLRHRLDGAGLMALEPGLAVEI